MTEALRIGYPRLSMRWLPPLLPLWLVLSLAAGCPATSSELHRGDTFASRGLWRQSTEAYRAALKHDPRDPKARTRLARAKRALAADLAARVSPALDLGKLDQADRFFAEAEDLHPTLATLDPLRSPLARAWLDEVVEGTGAGDLGRAFHAARRAAQITPDDAEAGSVRSAALHAYSDELSRSAQRYARVSLPGNMLCALIRLDQIDPDHPEISSRIRDARLAAKAATGYVVEMRISAPGAPRRHIARNLAKALAALEDNATCEGLSLVRIALEGPGASVRLAVESYSLLSRRSPRKEERRYLAGSRRVANPAHAEATKAIVSLKAGLEEAVTELKRRLATVAEQEVIFAEAPPEADDAALRQALSDARQTAGGARQAAEAAARGLADARRRLADTPKKIDEPIQKTAQIEISEVVRRAELEVDLLARDLASGEVLIPLTPIRVDASTSDSTHPALPRASVAADPLTFPESDEELETKVLEKMSHEISNQILGLCQQHSAALQEAPAQLSSDAPREEATETWVRAVLRAGGELSPEARAFFTKTWGLHEPERILQE